MTYDNPVFLTIFTLILYIICSYIRKRRSHYLKIIISYFALRKINRIESFPKKYYYLRSIDPYVFEEMVLSALSRKGHKIIRNKRYSGDGGIDGKAVIDGQLTYIQSKRYRSHINPSHVQDFNKLCCDHNVRGLFIHTGKTGNKSHKIASRSSHIVIISGDKLFRLFSD